MNTAQPIKSLSECIDNINAFADEHGLIFDQEGECGFGRECVGLRRGSSWIDYNPINTNTFEYVGGLYDERLYHIAPEDAYHKHNCIAVLGRGEKAIQQLDSWVDAFKELNARFVEFPTGATGIQARLSGVTAWAVTI